MSSRWKSTTRLRQILIVAGVLLLPMSIQTNLGNGSSPNRSNDVSSRSCSKCNGDSDESDGFADVPSQDDRDAELNAASNAVLQLSAYLKSKYQRIAGLEQKLEASKKHPTRNSSCAITRKKVDLVSTSIRMTSAVYLKALSSLTSLTPIPSSTLSRWTRHLPS